MTTKDFAVIVFKSDDSVSAVPSSWINADKTLCAWPNKYPANFKKVLQNPDSKPESDWMWLEIDLKKRYSKIYNFPNVK